MHGDGKLIILKDFVRNYLQKHKFIWISPFFKLYKDYITLAIPNVLPKSSCLGTLVLKPRIKCFCETLGLYAPLRIPSKCKRAAVGKILELPETKYLFKKMGKQNKFVFDKLYGIG